MTTLIDKLRAAETGSPELSAEVFKEFNPRYKDWIVSVTGRVVSHPHFKQAVPFEDYTQSIDAALTLVPEGWRTVMSHRNTGCYLRLVKYWGEPEMCEYMPIENHKSLPIAICIAVLEARK